MTEFRYCPQCATPLVTVTEPNGEQFPGCPKGHFVFYNSPVSATAGFLQQDGKYLLLKRAHEPRKGFWDTPGGYLSGGETPPQGLKREFKEETGLDVEVGDLIGIYTRYDEDDRPTLDFAYAVTLVGGTLQLDPKEIADSAWFAPADFPDFGVETLNQAAQDVAKMHEE